MFSKLPPVTLALLVANVVAFLASLAMLGGSDAAQLARGAYHALALQPVGVDDVYATAPFGPWQVVTYAFLHDDFAHLFFNMLPLVMFGAQVEYHWGARRFLTYYATCIVGAALCQLAVVYLSVHFLGGRAYETVGASGGVFGLLLAYGLLFPNQRVMLLIPPVPMKASTLVIVYGVIELVFGVTGAMPGVAHFAHLGGMLFGWLLIRHWRGGPPRRGRRPSKPYIRIVH